jgi:hypothetical protein
VEKKFMKTGILPPGINIDPVPIDPSSQLVNSEENFREESVKSEDDDDNDIEEVAKDSLLKKRVAKAVTKISESNEMMISKKDMNLIKKEGDTG